MCITFFCICPETAPSLELMFSFNREECTHRDTVALHRFQEDPNIYAGRDMVSKGSWLGFNRVTGLLVVLTNYWMQEKRLLRSRGQLVLSFLRTGFVPEGGMPYLDEIVYKQMAKVAAEGQEYSPFNLTVINLRNGVVHYICSETPQALPRRLAKHQVHGICNSHYDEVWPKTQRGVQLFQEVVAQAGGLSEQGLVGEMGKVMRDSHRFSEDDEEESSIFVEPYQSFEGGERRTKTSLFLLVRRQGEERELVMKEVTYGKVEESQVTFRMIF